MPTQFVFPETRFIVNWIAPIGSLVNTEKLARAIGGGNYRTDLDFSEVLRISDKVVLGYDREEGFKFETSEVTKESLETIVKFVDEFKRTHPKAPTLLAGSITCMADGDHPEWWTALGFTEGKLGWERM